jgi:hypothetical protein
MCTTTECVISGPVEGESPDGAISDRIAAAQEHIDNTLSVFPYILDVCYSYSDMDRIRHASDNDDGDVWDRVDGVWVEDLQTGEVAQMIYPEFLAGRDAGLVRLLPLVPDLTDAALFKPTEATDLPPPLASPGVA